MELEYIGWIHKVILNQNAQLLSSSLKFIICNVLRSSAFQIECKCQKFLAEPVISSGLSYIQIEIWWD